MAISVLNYGIDALSSGMTIDFSASDFTFFQNAKASQIIVLIIRKQIDDARRCKPFIKIFQADGTAHISTCIHERPSGFQIDNRFI